MLQEYQTDLSKRPSSKKIFFLYPHSVIQDQMITLLIQSEYEVAVLDDHKKASSVLYHFKDSVLFINIEAELDESEWEQYIRGIMSTRERHGANIGILVYNSNPQLAEKYLMDIGVNGGFITLKLGLAESARIIMKSLDACEAKGGRKYVRVKVPSGKAEINVVHEGRLLKGQILDLSSAGVACVFPSSFSVGQVLPDVQMSLWGSRIMIQAKVAGIRQETEDKKVHVLMFVDLQGENKGKIYAFIKKALQVEADI